MEHYGQRGAFAAKAGPAVVEAVKEFIRKYVTPAESEQSTIKPITKSVKPLSHGYRYLTGVWKDTLLTTVNKHGDTIRSAQTIIVPIKPIRQKF